MKLLFVCLGNICRSPLAEGIMRQKLEQAGLNKKIMVDSVGFEPFHKGDPPDHRAIRVAKNHGIDISTHRARLFTEYDFEDFDKIYVMDSNNYHDVMSVVRNEEDKRKVDYLMNSIRPGSNAPIPDPWYGNQEDFEHTYRLLDKATDKILNDLLNSPEV